MNSISYDHFADDRETKARFDKALDLAVRWLNFANKKGTDDGDWEPVTRDYFFAYYDREGNKEFDIEEPRLLPQLLCERPLGGDHRVTAYELDPFHDEGGPAIMTCVWDNMDIQVATWTFDTYTYPIYQASGDGEKYYIFGNEFSNVKGAPPV